MKTRTLLLPLLLLALPFTMTAKVTLPPFFSDNMVLQHGSAVRIWGTAEPDTPVKITASWARPAVKVRSDAQGNWSALLTTPAPGGPYTLTVSDGEKRVLKNVLIGEVWLCSGQSNMEMRVADKVTGWEKELAEAASHGNIRLLMVRKEASAREEEEVALEGDGWMECSAATLENFSATAWFFGKKLAEELDVPVGLIESCWGGTIIEAWTSGRTLAQTGRFQAQLDLMARMPADKESRAALFEENVRDWESQMRRLDPAFRDGEPLWALPQADVSDWIPGQVPGFLQQQGIEGMHGYFWMRKDLDLPADWAGQDLVLRLGAVDDNDCTYFNGEWIGHTEVCVTHRRYTVPGRLVRPGKNTIAVRVMDTGGMSGIMGGDDILYLAKSDSERIPLTGTWQCKESLAMDQAPLFPVNLDVDVNFPTVLYNAMIHPLRDYRIRGAIWYQGESNTSEAQFYKVLMPAMIRDWRLAWGYEFPFYYAQIANFMDEQTGPEHSDWAALREAQLQSLAVRNTGMAVLIDIGEAADIHPKNKPEAGRRLALQALAGTYGRSVEPDGPLYAGYSIEGDAIRLRFTHAEGGLATSDGGPLKGFYIAGPDEVFHPAEAVIEGETVVVSAESVTIPVAVRYGWANNPPCNLVGATGLPASPLRTDTWKP